MKTLNINLYEGSNVKLTLGTNQIASTKEAEGLAVSCEKGSVWITFERGRNDYVLHPGEQININASGRMVIQALAASEVTFVPQTPPTHALPSSPFARSPDYWRTFVAGFAAPRTTIDNPL